MKTNTKTPALSLRTLKTRTGIRAGNCENPKKSI